MVDGGDEDLAATEAVKDDVRSAADDEFAEVGLACWVAQMRLQLEGLHECNDARGEAFGGCGVIEGDVGADFAKASERQGRPDDFKR